MIELYFPLILHTNKEHFFETFTHAQTVVLNL